MLCYVVREIFSNGENIMERVNTVCVTQYTGTDVTAGGTYSGLRRE